MHKLVGCTLIIKSIKTIDEEIQYESQYSFTQILSTW